MPTGSCLSEELEAGDDDIFEIEDYYVASDLEGLIVVFENLLKEWKPLLKDKLCRRTTLTRGEISVEVEILIPGSSEADPDHPIALLDLPVHISLVPHITTSVGNEARYVLSAACMASLSVGIDVPFITACDDSMWIGRSLMSRYQVEVLDWNIPERLTNLGGIVSLFYDLTERSPPKQIPMITVEYAYNYQQFGFDDMIGHNLRKNKTLTSSALKWGCREQQRLLLRLVARWTPFPEGTFTSNSIFTDFRSESAPIWRLHCQLAPGSEFNLISLLKRFLAICSALSDSVTLEAITQRDHSFTPSYVIEEQVRAVFQGRDSMLGSIPETNSMKSCPFQSLLSNLVLAMMQQSLHEPYRIAQMFIAFVAELQRYWDEGQALPGLNHDTEAAIPDMNCCLLYQKLQVLNQCIKLRTVAVDGGAQLVSPVVERARRWADYDYDDLKNGLEAETEPSVGNEPLQSADAVPEGVNYDITLPGVYLLNGKAKMHVPITLESPLLTEDQIEAQHEIMANLGTDHQSSNIRAELQSSSLQSDMSAFKAANPGAELGDFVRWYSPNDWIEGQGLSKRMSSSDNLWRRCWMRAIPCPASRQRPLFNYVAQGELILDYFRTITPSALMEQLAAIAISNAASVIGSVLSDLDAVPFAREAIERMFQKAESDIVVARIEQVERIAEMVTRLSGSALKPSEIDEILRYGSSGIESDRERVIELMHEKWRSLGYPDHQIYTISAQDNNDNNLYVAVQLDGGSLITVPDRSWPSQMRLCSALPIN